MSRVRSFAKRALRAILHRRPRDPELRDVLFLCQNGLMADYLGPFFEAIADEPRLRCFVTYPRGLRAENEEERIRRQLPLPRIRMGIAECRPWDLIVTADHGYDGLATRLRCPAIYTGHGMTGKVVPGEDADYSYGPRALLADGTPRYSAMLEASEANRARVARRDPVLASTIRVVGSLQDDRLLGRLGERDAIRDRLGYRRDERVVLVQSTWGPDCLFQTVGEQLLTAITALRGGRDRFVLSVHPHEYRPNEDGRPSWGTRLRALDESHVRVREPDQPWIPEMIAADVVLTDHTSLVVYAALAAKPTLWVPVRDGLVEPGTVLDRLRTASPVLEDPTQLSAALDRAEREFSTAASAELAHEINSKPGEARRNVRAIVAELTGVDLADCGPEPDTIGDSRTACEAADEEVSSGIRAR